MDARRTEGSPLDRLTRLCDRMTDAMEADPEHRDGDKAIVMLTNDGESAGGLIMYGYDDDAEAVADLFLQLKALFEVNGKTLILTPAGGRSPN